MAEFEGLDPNSERDEIRDIISALSQGNAGEEKLEKDISSIKKNVDVIVSNTMSGPSKEEREENARQEKNNAKFLADLLAQKLADIFGKQLEKLKEIAENTKPLAEEGGFKVPFLPALAASGAVAGVAGRQVAAAKAIKDSRIVKGSFVKFVKNPLVRLFKFIGNISFGKSGDSIRVRLISLRVRIVEFFAKLNTRFFGSGDKNIFTRISNFFDKIKKAFGPTGRIGKLFAEGGSLSSVSKLFKDVTGFFGKFKRVFKSLFRFVPFLGQLLIAFDAITGFIKGFTAEDGGFLKGIRQAFASVIEGLSFGLLSEEGVMGFFDQVIEGLTNFFGSIVHFVEFRLVPFFTETVPDAFEKVKLFFIKTIPDFFSVTLPGYLKLAIANVSFFFTDSIPTAFMNLVDRVKIMVNNVAAMLMDGAASIIEAFNDKISGIPFLEDYQIGGAAALRGGAAASRALSADLEDRILERTADTENKLENIRRDITSEMERKMEARERVFEARQRAEREAGAGTSTVIVQNSTTPVSNNFALESTPSPVSADMEAAAYAMSGGMAFGG